MSKLTFEKFSEVNEKRCVDVFHKIEDWSPTDWACAAAGEMGEACNLIKKARRGDNVDIDDVADELADIVTYVDLLSKRLGINLSEAIINKFNKVSNRYKSDIKL